VSHEFVGMSLEDLNEIILSDELNSKNENNVFNSIIKWIDFDAIKRKKVYLIFNLNKNGLFN
jgi:hypothetical protein